MTRVVAIDASVLLKLLSEESERHIDQARTLLDSWESGAIGFIAPELLALEVLNVAGRKWQLKTAALRVVADALRDFDIDFVQVDSHRIAHWVGKGLTAYDAAYVVAAELRGVRLVTDDDQIVAAAPKIALALANATL